LQTDRDQADRGTDTDSGGATNALPATRCFKAAQHWE